MKKSFTLACFSIALFTCFIIGSLLINPFSNTLEASTINQYETIKKLESTTKAMAEQIKDLETNLTTYQNSLETLQSRVTEMEDHTNTVELYLIDYYIDKLSDPTYVNIYNTDYVYYTAAENLGQIGKPAIPKLINRLDTSDDYERALVLYALLLATQDESVKAFTHGEYIEVSLDFDARNHPDDVKLAQKWWNKYQAYF